MNKCNVKKNLRTGNLQLLLMVMPAIIHVFIFSYIPMGGIIVAFKDFKFSKGIFDSSWNGFANFEFLFKSSTFANILRNTIGYNLMFMFLGVFFAVSFALLLERIKSKAAIKIFQSTMFLPNFLSWVVVSYISFALLEYNSGVINGIIEACGGKRIQFYAEPKWWPFILPFFSVWKGVGFNTLVYYGSILGIDPSLYEAAIIDGCGYFKRVYHITLPHLKHTIIILLIMGIGGIFRSDYGLFYFIPKDTALLYDVTDVLDSYIIRTLRTATNVGMSSAAGFLQSVVGLIFVTTANAIVRKVDNESALF